MTESVYKIKHGDMCLQSKHADVCFRSTFNTGFTAFWFDNPHKGKCTCVAYDPESYPALVVVVQANWKARNTILWYERQGGLYVKGVF